MSVFEIFFFILSVLFFLKLVDNMGVVFLWSPHFVRGVMGLLVNKKLPNSHQIVKEIEFTQQADKKNSYIQFEEVRESIKS